MPLIEFRNVSKYYPGNIVAVKDITLIIEEGEFVSIVGQSGTGKTTLVRLLIAEEPLSEGRILVAGWDITNIHTNEVPILRKQIGVVFQDFKLLPTKTVFENVAFALEVSNADKNRIQSIVPQLLKIVGLQEKAERFPHELSGGEQQRVVIARALAHRPKILVADEPTGNLDSINTKEIVELLKKINEFGTTVILVTHNKDTVNELKRRVIMIDQGRVQSDHQKGRYLLK
ncbi:MAG: cell division ATP-binding protein FtsE [Candidatus Kerfeldbacteria bacterium]|nr:cell division ATP-binding protein FtsE [Candidatus Kerfeldbacteria bacterium]